jgi:hypothetical protein
MEKEEVIAIIRDAFRDVSRENGVSLHEALVIDVYGSKDEQRKARKQDTDTHWTEIPDHDLEHASSALCYMDPVSWRYHIPGYMIWVLSNYMKSDSFTVDNTIYTFELENNEVLYKYDMEKFKVLNEEQSRAVARFLKYMIDHHDGRADVTIARRAFRGYWKRFI